MRRLLFTAVLMVAGWFIANPLVWAVVALIAGMVILTEISAWIDARRLD
jgi:hypothetical protein